MKKYDLKRAIVTKIKSFPMDKERGIIDNLSFAKDGIKHLGPAVDREQSKSFKQYRKEIQRLREASRTFRSQCLEFQVEVKKYKKIKDVEWVFDHKELGPETRVQYKEMLKGVVDKAIQLCRLDLQIQPKADRFGTFIAEFNGRKKQGRVFVKEGEILRMYVEKNIKNLYTDKVPVEPKKYIGIELEFCAPIKENLFALKLFKAGVHKFAQLKKDGSLRPDDDEVGYELAILLEESNYKKRLKQIISILTEVGAIAKDRRAGLHVHIDMRRRDKDLVYHNLVSCQYALLSIVDPKRYNNEFCRVVDSRKFPTEFTGERSERYKTINAAAFYKYKTLEVRMHEGSVDYTQISNWVDLIIKIANYSKKLKNDVAKVETLGKRLDLDKKLFSYMQDRSCFWQVQNTEEARSLRGMRDRVSNRHSSSPFDDMMIRPISSEGLRGAFAAPTAPSVPEGSRLVLRAEAPMQTTPVLNDSVNYYHQMSVPQVMTLSADQHAAILRNEYTVTSSELSDIVNNELESDEE